LSLIEVEYEPLGVVDDPVYARQPDAPILHENWHGQPAEAHQGSSRRHRSGLCRGGM